MKHGKTYVLVGMSGAALLVLVAAVVMFRGLAEAAQTRRDRDGSRNQLQSYYVRNPFPAEDNVERERENLETVRSWFERLHGELRASNIPRSESSPIAFNSRREAVTADLLAKAPTGRSGERMVPADFSFGFDEYKTGELANPADVPRLMRQLRMIELLVRELYGAGVLQLQSVTREKFEKAVAGAATNDALPFEGRGRGRGLQPGLDPGAAARQPLDADIDAAIPLDRQRFSFEFVTHESALVDLLNRIAAMDMFAVVTRVELTKDGRDYRPPPAPEERAAADAERPGVTRMPPNRSARVVSGRGREAPVKVQLDVEVYSFESEGEG